MLKFSLVLIFIFSICSLCGQLTLNPKFEKKIDKLIQKSVPIISVEDAFDKFENYIFLDARESEEFETSHIDGAVSVGYQTFSTSTLDLEKDSNIVIYCSVGYRSEIIGKKLKDAGYKNVYNLYGSIFEWVNQGHQIVNIDGDVTNRLHTYNYSWSKWVEDPSIKKVW